MKLFVLKRFVGISKTLLTLTLQEEKARIHAPIGPAVQERFSRDLNLDLGWRVPAFIDSEKSICPKLGTRRRPSLNKKERNVLQRLPHALFAQRFSCAICTSQATSFRATTGTRRCSFLNKRNAMFYKDSHALFGLHKRLK